MLTWEDLLVFRHLHLSLSFQQVYLFPWGSIIAVLIRYAMVSAIVENTHRECPYKPQSLTTPLFS